MYLIKNIQANRVNLVQNDFVAGTPPISAVLGYVGAALHHLGHSAWMPRVIPILHDVTMSQGRPRPEYRLKNGNFIADDVAEGLIGSVNLSILVDLPGLEDDVDRAMLQKALRGRRFGGGEVFSDISVEDVATDGSAFRKSPRGHVILPHDGPFGEVEEGAIAALTEYLYERDHTLKLLPAAVGLKYLEKREDAVQRKGVRDAKVPHIFASPVNGVVEVRSARNPDLLALETEALKELFFVWTYTSKFASIHPLYALKG